MSGPPLQDRFVHRKLPQRDLDFDQMKAHAVAYLQIIRESYPRVQINNTDPEVVATAMAGFAQVELHLEQHRLEGAAPKVDVEQTVGRLFLDELG